MESEERTKRLAVPLEEWKRDDLNAEIAHLKAQGIETPKMTVTNDAKREFIKSTRKQPEGDGTHPMENTGTQVSPVGAPKVEKPRRSRSNVAAPDAEPKLKSYRGHPVLREAVKLISGRRYVEIFTSEASYVLSQEEYNNLAK